ncbi:MAG: iron-containing alcohol dehydrogenase [Gammaproteobacteria bacterium]|nr:iron-containing alcohol dehydrogenase [Gammaproteobacteria bacterium]MBU1731322.1 iron-containing alcohol dehydrogenase [Gammaproteobacteria bacterium]MBU1892827.1 iron-containing alcohol dehydrogenase [Gammaproteobacteria bacterium]
MSEMFSIARLPRIDFGPGSIMKLPALLARYGKRVLLVTGGASFCATPYWAELSDTLRDQGFAWEIFRVNGEPSPQLVDDAVAVLRGSQFDVVLGIGGGSVLDAAKAIAGLLGSGNSVMDYLEGVGPELPYLGPSTPFIAVPTTAGTGSEATKNAVLSAHGPEGFKKSFRDEQLVPEYAVVDPDLLASCPPHLIAANGMDAFTQLLESFVSSKANPFTDALAWSGMEAVRDGLMAWYEGGEDAAMGREKMAYAALLSGITLAQVGLGAVHGLAAPLGAFFPIPHGVVCGTLLEAATRENIQVMEARDPANPALAKYARVGRLLRGKTHVDDVGARGVLLKVLGEWTERMGLPRLGEFGVNEADLPRIVANCRGSSMKTNPIVISDAEVGNILQARL